MSTNVSMKLLECPFCGGEAEILTAESMHGGLIAGIMCNGCSARSDVYDTEAEAIAAWNTRYHSAFDETVIKAWQEIKEYQERTCKNVDEYARAGFFICGNCRFGENGIELTPNYCPSCGAKVIGD